MASIFTQIINREIPGYIIAEEDPYIAFLDIHPITKGHTLVVPKKEVDDLFTLDDETLARLCLFAKKVALGIQNVIPCLRIGMAVVGLEVPHAHIHLIPLHNQYDIDFKRPKLQFTHEELGILTTQMKQAIAQESSGSHRPCV